MSEMYLNVKGFSTLHSQLSILPNPGSTCTHLDKGLGCYIWGSGAGRCTDCLFLNWLLSSGISFPAELIVLSSSRCPWEEIFASWRRVGFLGCRISPLWHLASSQTRADIHCCVDLQNQSCLEGRDTQLSIWRDSKRWSTSLLRVSRARGGSSPGGSSSSVPTWVHHSLTQILLHFETLWGLSLLFIIYFTFK